MFIFPTDKNSYKKLKTILPSLDGGIIYIHNLLKDNFKILSIQEVFKKNQTRYTLVEIPFEELEETKNPTEIFLTAQRIKKAIEDFKKTKGITVVFSGESFEDFKRKLKSVDKEAFLKFAKNLRVIIDDTLFSNEYNFVNEKTN